MLEVKKCNFKDLEAYQEFVPLCNEYSKLTPSIIPHKEIRYDIYRVMDSNAMLRCASVTYEDKLIGFLIVTITPLLHHGSVAASVDSIYVANDYRQQAAGANLKSKAKELAKEAGAEVLIFNVPVDSDLEIIVKATKSVVLTNRVYMMSLRDE